MPAATTLPPQVLFGPDPIQTILIWKEEMACFLGLGMPSSLPLRRSSRKHPPSRERYGGQGR
jgi:hypothetical protein